VTWYTTVSSDPNETAVVMINLLKSFHRYFLRPCIQISLSLW